jgi:hypothetical protein
MSMRLLAGGLTVAALLTGGGRLPPAAAKPPDLPIEQKVVCQPAGGSEVIGAGVHADAGLSGGIVLGEPPPAEAGGTVDGQIAFGPIDIVCPCVCELFGQCWQSFWCGQTGEATGPAPAGSTCPYLQQEAAAPPAPAKGLALPGNRVLDNLDNLELAQRILRQAERCRAERPDLACRYYEQVRRLCPGSRYDLAAAAQLDQLRGAGEPDATAAAGEEQEPSAARKAEPERPDREAVPALAGEVAQLLEKCQHTLAAGRCEEAAHLVHRALGLQRILLAVGEPAPPRLILQKEEPGDAEEQEADPAARSLLEPPQMCVPDLWVEPPPEGLLLQLEGGPVPPEPAGSSEPEPPCGGLGQVLRELAAALQAVACAEVDVPQPGRVRARCQIHLGAVGFIAKVDNDHGFVALSLWPATAGDLRELPRGHRDRVSRWLDVQVGDAPHRPAGEPVYPGCNDTGQGQKD